MMGRLREAFDRARAEDRAALVVYLCAGDPSLAATPRLIEAAAKAGADVIEVGVPFSDPTADGIAIQRASERALRAGTTLPGVLEAIVVSRRLTDVPILLFGYYNPILSYGEARLVDDARVSGVDGFLVVDLPPEECAPLRVPAVAAGLDYVPLVAPTSREARIDAAAGVATAFLYYVSLTGVTGAAAPELESASRRAAEIAARTGFPVAVGFGVKTPADVRVVGRHANGVVVGSAVVQAIADAPSVDAAVWAVTRLVGELRAATSRSA